MKDIQKPVCFEMEYFIDYSFDFASAYRTKCLCFCFYFYAWHFLRGPFSNLAISTCIVAGTAIKTLLIEDFLFLVMSDPAIDGFHMHCYLRTGPLWRTWAAKINA